MDARTQPFVASPEAYQALATLLERAWPESPASAAWLAREDAHRDLAKGHRRELVLEGGCPVAVLEWSLHPRFADDSYFLASLAVDPAFGRRGLGAALLRRLLDALPADRPLRLEGGAPEDRPWAGRLLARFGFSPVGRNVRSELDLSTFDPSGFEALARRVAAAGVRLEPLGTAGAADERLLRRLHALELATVRDVPGVDTEADSAFAPWRTAYQDNPDLLPDAHVLALAGDEVVGMTQLWASQATDRILYTGYTGVARSHRRLGLATALKVRSLSWARGLRTGDGRVPLVRTSNAAANHMLGINVRLGFVAGPAMVRYQLHRP